MQERKLATIRSIAEIKAIPEADKIVAYRVDGWWVVDSKDKYAVGDLVVYIEPDAWVPTSLAPFLSKGNEPREYQQIKGERLRTIKLKKQLSQGLLLPLRVLGKPEEIFSISPDSIGADVTTELGIVKWEPPAEFRSADAKGLFPSFIPKTDQERIQNMLKAHEDFVASKHVFEKTEKIDGSSITVFVKDGVPGVCSRNLELKEDDTNTWWKLAKQYDLINKLLSTGRNYALQGEIYGSGLNGNIYALQDQRFMLYDIFDIDNQKYLLPEARSLLAVSLGIPQVPIIGNVVLEKSVDEMLLDADGKSIVNPKTNREGFVYKSMTEPDVSFKVISNKYLLGAE